VTCFGTGMADPVNGLCSSSTVFISERSRASPITASRRGRRAWGTGVSATLSHHDRALSAAQLLPTAVTIRNPWQSALERHSASGLVSWQTLLLRSFNSCETAVVICACAKGLESRTLFGTP
jgi:hypothetical protein